jgi:hypothetical protein
MGDTLIPICGVAGRSLICYRGVLLDTTRDMLTPVATYASILHCLVPATTLRFSHGKDHSDTRIGS